MDKQDFMRAALGRPGDVQTREFVGPPVAITPFADWDFYFLDKALTWEAGGAGAARLPKVEVPPGFVTDLASIPKVFWNVLPPQGRYTYPAIVHDYLYWFQPCTRGDADEVLKVAMQDLGVGAVNVTAIYQSVNLAGGKAWSGNAAARAAGQKRVLSRFPTDMKTTWAAWKQDPAHFA